MRIIYKDTFVERLERQLKYIAKKSPKSAKNLKTEIIQRIKEIPENPYLFRKSIYFENEAIRDLIYKGYTVVFRINENQIEVFGFTKFQEKPTD
ncbi:type II toxin-antitoxin system RelE/ParE family toxin [Wenyingzhuangia sp. 2_MG-2023]|uniref:type II toxin-antitoxin system RelE/ParE family toxin n=1 Tax=Wenyingzhuangia sp. 2_MG-2023 TaxID=3062639 RepID=UPI0026E1CE45|nr:type II toxin-antitoxin system RelE/ParE family toxin [Wenyingzhuangia sp. 2_MG-2023]MDO6739446.1 type II toxin-antitoxin system RelE/ParE family toxin [Wenyingzhuangia sp. 2_MG-2023]